MTSDHPTDWAHKYVKAKALREAAQAVRGGAISGRPWRDASIAAWLEDRANELEQR